jgi:hypothetical protein
MLFTFPITQIGYQRLLPEGSTSRRFTVPIRKNTTRLAYYQAIGQFNYLLPPSARIFLAQPVISRVSARQWGHG